ncbi:protein of unknown function (plasmid) [Cupriavidus taiwanensis]|uniref:Uncharacterized protein n=1 Tax=Cupriavidus taiwanensis TaxID=164546 RepID=A0A9Q7XVR3_9BURK|nr:protein of unknown function [Cupriavidus taiwanensis]
MAAVTAADCFTALRTMASVIGLVRFLLTARCIWRAWRDAALFSVDQSFAPGERGMRLPVQGITAT